MRLIFPLILLVLSISGCAQISPLIGGDKDIYAPTIDSSKTFPINGALNYAENEITIKFNEYIKLNNANDNIIITPQLKEKLTISAKNKTFSLVFNETLQENTTYVLNFNGAVQDITEKNDSIFQYVFSTGSYIDSLTLSGNVKDGYTNKPVDNCFIAIYPATNTVQYDSIPFLLKPTYIGQTNKTGNYTINYLKDGEYVVFAFNDENKNMKLDSDEEKIGFLTQKTILINEIVKDLDFRLFSLIPNKTLITKAEFTYPGKLEVVFNKTPELFNLSSNVELVEQNTNAQDSLVFWMIKKPSQKISFYTSLNSNELDTITPYLKNQPKDADLEKLIITSNIKVGQLLLPEEDLVISLNEPIQNVNAELFHFYNSDSIEVEVENQVDNLSNIIFYTSVTRAAYLQIDSLAVESFYGNFNHDKPLMNFENLIAEDYYGTLILNLDSLTESYSFELLNDKQKIVEVIRTDSLEVKLIFNELPPGKYQLRAIQDKNNDEIWTAGSIIDLIQPEKVYYYTDEIRIRSKWDLEIEWVITE